MADPFADLGAEPAPPPRRGYRRRPGSGWHPGLRLLAVVVGLVVATAAGWWVYDRVQLERARSRLKELNTERRRVLDAKPLAEFGQKDWLAWHAVDLEEAAIYRRHPSLRP